MIYQFFSVSLCLNQTLITQWQITKAQASTVYTDKVDVLNATKCHTSDEHIGEWRRRTRVSEMSYPFIGIKYLMYANNNQSGRT